MRRLALSLLAAVSVTGCSAGQDCGDLAAVTAERDVARADWREIADAEQAGQATHEDLSQAHDRMHALDIETYDLEQSCEEG